MLHRGVSLGFHRYFRGAVIALAASAGFRATAQEQPPVPPVPHVLVYEDGDRVQGRLVARDGDVLVFRTLKFGEIRVSAQEAHVIVAPPVIRQAPGSAAGNEAVDTPAESRDTPSDTPEGLAHFFKGLFGQWTGRFSLSTELTQDATDRSSVMMETVFKRVWEADEVNLTMRYEYNETKGATASDLFKGNGLWRHTLPSRLFVLYRPYYEWNRSESLGVVNSNYILLQQELGVGVHLVETNEWNVRVGVSENFFDNWDLHQNGHTAGQAESVFVDASLKLRWRITVTERVVYYYAIFNGGSAGWEHQFEITKKLTDTLSLGLRQESRYNDPDLRSNDYSMLRLLMGFDF